MVILLLLALFLSPQQNSKVVVNTGVRDAEFYLDATFVGATDKSGSFTMEGFPAGTFNYIIKKRGYKTYKGSFTLLEGESQLIQPVMEKLDAPPAPEEPTPRPQRSIKPVGKKSSARDNARPVAKMMPPPAAPNSQPGDSVPQTPGTQAPQEKESATSFVLLPVFVILAGLIALGLWIWRRKRDSEDMPMPEEIPDGEEPVALPSGTILPEPLFIEELKRREEQLKAGFVGNNPPHIDRELMKDKEVVIVLPKEAYRYEEDK